MKSDFFFIAGVFTGLLFPLVSLAHLGVEGEIVIHMYDDRYEPKDVVIQQGGEAIFENVGSYDRWPASNIHPTHTLYPGSDIDDCGTSKADGMFDACEPIQPGKSYHFQFHHSGVWRYHDHLDPRLAGTITVEETEGYEVPGTPSNSDNQVKDNEEKGFFRRLLDAIRAFFRMLFGSADEIDLSTLRILDIAGDAPPLKAALKELGVAAVMEKLIEESDGGSEIDCHTPAHYVGRAGFELFHEATFEACDPSCHSGCYHGAMERFLIENGTATLAQDIDRICNAFDTSFGKFECLHGVGHGLLAYLDYDLPGALEACRQLPDSFSQSSCFGGVFMENIVTGQGLGATDNPHETTWVNKTDYHYPCNAIGEDHDVLYQCYQMQTSWMLTLSSYNFDTVSQECLSAPRHMIPVCFKSFGRDAAGHTLRDPHQIIALCDKVPKKESYHADCIIGALNVIVDFWGPLLEAQASEFCALTATQTKSVCYNTLASRLPGLFSDATKRSAVCATFEDDYQYLCQY